MTRNDSRPHGDVLAASGALRVLITPSGELRLIAPRFVIGMDRETCEELATTLARAVVELARRRPRSVRRSHLYALGAAGEPSGEPGGSS
jgi:hypothetical protein